MKKIILLFVFLIPFFTAFSQSTFLPLGNDGYHLIDRREISDDSVIAEFHTSLKPYDRRRMIEYAERVWDYRNPLRAKERHNLYYLFKDNSEFALAQVDSKRPILKIFYKNPADLFAVNVKDFFLKVNPLIDLQVGAEKDSSKPLYINTRGVELRGMVDEKVGFYFFLTDNQTRPPLYVQNRVNEGQAVPGEGFYKLFKDNKGFDFLSARGYITFPVLKHVDFQFGHDKNFIGNGYRSLFLSDYSNNYFFLKLNTHIWKLNYQNIFAELTQQHIRGEDKIRPKKYAVFHHLSINLFKRLNIGLFESVIYKHKKYELQYLNPIIFYRAVEQGLGSPDNAVVGLDYKLILFKHFSLYGQFFLDEFNFQILRKNYGWWGNKFGVQAGLKWIDIFGIQNLDAQAEINFVRPYTYTHHYVDSDFTSIANYTHYNQPLAHPLGANFKETIGILRYQPYAKWFITAKIIIASYGTDTLGSNWGGNIFQDYTTRERDSSNAIGQGVNTKLYLADFTVSYMLRHNMWLDLKYLFRKTNSVLDLMDTQTQFGAIALRWNLYQRKYDF